MAPIEDANTQPRDARAPLRDQRVRGHPGVSPGVRRAPSFGPEHYERLLRNARLLRASVPESADDLLEITLELLRRNAHDGDAYVRPIIYKAAHSIRVQLSDLEDRIGIFTIPLGDYLPTGDPGHRVRVAACQ